MAIAAAAAAIPNMSKCAAETNFEEEMGYPLNQASGFVKNVAAIEI